MDDELPEDIRWIHVSDTDLGDEVVFEPRIPRSPFESMSGVIEDIVTPRTSWAPSLRAAIDATGDNIYGNYRRKTYYVYGVEDLPGFVDPGEEFSNCQVRLSSPGNEYGMGFDLDKYFEEQGYDPTSSDWNQGPYKEKFKYCIPDALEYGEVWATQPVQADKIGILQKGEFVPIEEVVEENKMRIKVGDLKRVIRENLNLTEAKIGKYKYKVSLSHPMTLGGSSDHYAVFMEVFSSRPPMHVYNSRGRYGLDTEFVVDTDLEPNQVMSNAKEFEDLLTVTPL